eukprot:1263334-Rhodomonas_salina.1
MRCSASSSPHAITEASEPMLGANGAAAALLFRMATNTCDPGWSSCRRRQPVLGSSAKLTELLWMVINCIDLMRC